MIDKYELKQILQNQVATVIFTKGNGETREMKCTLMAEYLPAMTGPVLLNENKTENPNSICVWDVEKNSWRAFRLDSVQNIQVNAT